MFSTSPWRGRKGTVAALSSWLSLLFLSCPLAVTAKSASDYYVPSLPGAPDGPLLKMHAGHIEVDQEHNGNLFFWHFQNRHIANRQRTVIWLNGGPGCSSLDGALMEVGPYRLKDDHTLEYNNGSWDEFANLLFVDQPVGTGFSYVNTNSFLHELDEMGAQFITFLTNWFQLFPEYENDDIYIAGESYAGQHIPYITKHILERNKNAAASGKAKWNVRGLLIGNGWVSPADQYPSYLEFAYKEGIVQTGSQKANNLEALQSACISTLTAPGGTEHVDNGKCEEVLQELLRLTADNGGQCYNMYDVRLRDEYPSCGMNWPPDLVNVKPYLRQPEVVKALNINPDKKTGWEECSGAVSSSFRAKHSLPAIDLLPDILESGVPILLFSGDKDLICNHLGTEQLIHNMKWGGGSGFELSPGIWAPRRDWTFEGEPAGLYQQARNLTYVLFYNASHMVPFDFPRRTRDMLDRFMKVDIASIGGTPADSRIDGEKLPQTSVGGQPNSTTAEEKEKERLKEATWKAYAKSGETALVIVIIGVSVWGYFIWRSRRNRRGYREVRQRGRRSTASALERFRSRSNGTDIEAGDFDETTLDQLSTPRTDQDRFSVGAEDSEDENAARRNGATGAPAPHKGS